MFTPISFNKRIPVTDGPVFELIGSNPFGFGIFIENQDAANTMVYHFESSPDGGVTWNTLSFATQSGSASIFAVLAGDVHLVKITTADQRTRLVAHGDLEAALHLSLFKRSSVNDTPVSIVY